MSGRSIPCSIVSMLVGLLLLVLTTGCNTVAQPQEAPPTALSEDTEEPAAPTEAAAEPTEAPEEAPEGANTELIIAANGLPRSLDPTTTALTEARNVFGHLWDPLIHMAPDGTLVPVLADSWERVSDTTWRLVLHPDVQFSNGEPVNAEAVRFTLARYQDPETHQRASWYEDWEVTAVDDLTIEITTPSLDALFLRKLVDAVYIVPPAYFQEAGQEGFAEAPIGSGPYLFQEWVRGDHLTLVANEEYWRGSPAIKTVVFRDLPEDSTRVAALLAGEADIAIAVPYPQIETVEADENVTIATIASTQSWYIGLQLNTAEALQDVRVRQALNYAVDKEALIDVLFQGYATPLGQPVPPTYEGYNPPDSAAPYPYDPEQARALLAEAGYDDGLTLELDIATSGLGPSKEIGEAVSGYWQSIGVQTTMNQWEYGAFVDRMFGGQFGETYTLFLRSSSATAGELFTAALVCGASFNWNGYCNEELDGHVNAALTTFDVEEQLAAYREAEGIVHDDAPWVFLFVPDLVYGVREGLNWNPRSDERIFAFEDVSW